MAIGSEQAYSCYKTTQQPDYSFPYVVSIACRYCPSIPLLLLPSLPLIHIASGAICCPLNTGALQVMQHDTLNSIAVKFETTPAELARLNRKPLGATSTVFNGEVRSLSPISSEL